VPPATRTPGAIQVGTVQRFGKFDMIKTLVAAASIVGLCAAPATSVQQASRLDQVLASWTSQGISSSTSATVM